MSPTRGRAATPHAAACCLAAALMATAPSARAWGTLLLIDAPPPADTLAAGATLWSLPRSPGGPRQQTLLTPALDYERHDGGFLSTENGAGWNFSHETSWQAGARLWPQAGRAHADERPGAPAFGYRVLQEVFANAQLNRALLLQTGLSHGAGRDRDGLQAEVGVTSGVPIGPDLLGLGIAATWGNRAARRDQGGASASGWADTSWTVSVDHRFDAHWHADAQWQQARLRTAAGTPGFEHPSQRTALASLWRDF